MEIVQAIISVLAVGFALATYINLVKERRQREAQERKAGEYLARFIRGAEPGTTLLLAGTYRIRETLKVPVPMNILGVPYPGLTHIKSEGADPMVLVEDLDEVAIANLHLETMATGVRFKRCKPQLRDTSEDEDVKIILNTDNEPLDEILEREYKEPEEAVH